MPSVCLMVHSIWVLRTLFAHLVPVLKAPLLSQTVLRIFFSAAAVWCFLHVHFESGIIIKGDHENKSCYQVTQFYRITYCGCFDRLLLKPLGVRRLANLKNNHSQVTITTTLTIFTVLPVKYNRPTFESCRKFAQILFYFCSYIKSPPPHFFTYQKWF